MSAAPVCKPKGKAKSISKGTVKTPEISPSSTQTLSQSSPRTEPNESPPKENRIIPQEIIDNYRPWAPPTEEQPTFEKIWDQLFYEPQRKEQEEKRRREEEERKKQLRISQEIMRKHEEEERKKREKERELAEVERRRAEIRAKLRAEMETKPIDFFSQFNEMEEFNRIHFDYIRRGYSKIRDKFGPSLPELPYLMSFQESTDPNLPKQPNVNVTPLHTRMLTKIDNADRQQFPAKLLPQNRHIAQPKSQLH
ncbi:11326_t:CDS:2 [Acaulospora colombiana]|uniref:11326_t:CDS:1 n=1 Tax=Acaulospora colombiana TaxID=27376 RepID=A0ACA9P9J0_9GLOM|nr:11326_t:CDS:2 [Acaulospora colombiana]